MCVVVRNPELRQGLFLAGWVSGSKRKVALVQGSTVLPHLVSPATPRPAGDLDERSPVKTGVFDSDIFIELY